MCYVAPSLLSILCSFLEFLANIQRLNLHSLDSPNKFADHKCLWVQGYQEVQQVLVPQFWRNVKDLKMDSTCNFPTILDGLWFFHWQTDWLIGKLELYCIPVFLSSVNFKTCLRSSGGGGPTPPIHWRKAQSRKHAMISETYHNLQKLHTVPKFHEAVKMLEINYSWLINNPFFEGSTSKSREDR